MDLSQKTPLSSSSFTQISVLKIWDIPWILWDQQPLTSEEGEEQSSPWRCTNPETTSIPELSTDPRTNPKHGPTPAKIKLIDSIPAHTQQFFATFNLKFRFLNCKLHFPTCSTTFHTKDLRYQSSIMRNTPKNFSSPLNYGIQEAATKNI